MDSKCRSCGADILWVRMADTDRPHPVDALSLQQRMVLDGPLASAKRGAVRWTGTSHFATCPNAADHRKSRAAKDKP